MDDSLQCAERGQRDDPVAEDAVMDRFVFQFCSQFPFGDGIYFRKVLLKQFPMVQYLYRQMGQPQIAESHQILIISFLRLVERCLGESKEDDTGVKCHVLRGLVLSAKCHAGSDDGLGRHSVRTCVLFSLATATPKTFEVGYLADVKVVFVLVQYNKCVYSL